MLQTMAAEPKLTMDIELLRKLLTLDAATGRLYWRERPLEMFGEDERLRRQVGVSWNKCWAGKEAFTFTDSSGYRKGAVLGVLYKAHRVIWAISTGEWPEDQIDHINGDRGDNRPCNLRAVDNAANARNQRLRCTNTSGVMGVSRDSRSGKWEANIYVGGRKKFLGYYDDLNAAIAVRRAACRTYGYHPNHGSVAA